jgi:hypothetical protein
MITITVARALKLKNKLVSEINRLEDLIRQENVQEGGNTSHFDVPALTKELEKKIVDLTKVKGATAKANAEVYELIFLLSEYKSLIQFYRSVSTKEGVFHEPAYGGEVLQKVYSAAVNKKELDNMVSLFENCIEKLQEELDVFNHKTKIDVDIEL